MSFREHAGRHLSNCEGGFVDRVCSNPRDRTSYRRKASTPSPSPWTARASCSSSYSDEETSDFANTTTGAATAITKTATSEVIDEQDLSDLHGRGRSLVRSPAPVFARRRSVPSSPSGQDRGYTFPALKTGGDGSGQYQSMAMAPDSATERQIFEPRPIRRTRAPASGQSNLAVELSQLFAADPHMRALPVERSQEESNESSGPLAESPESALFGDDDVPVRPLAEGYRDTFALFNRHSKHQPSSFSTFLETSKKPKLSLPLLFLQRLALVIDHRSYLALRLTSSSWCAGITRVKPLVFPTVYRLPTEIIQEIYSYLFPVDFNAARHTCRAWMRASMRDTLLQSMLQKGGWWGAAEDRIKAFIQTSPSMPPLSAILQVLHLQLARECSLSANWTGTGVIEYEIAQEQPVSENKELNSCSCTHGDSMLNFQRSARYAARTEWIPGNISSPFSVVSIVDFSEFGEMQPFFQHFHGYSSDSETRHDSQVHFTASKCGKFLVVCDNHRVFVYELCQDAAVRFVTCISCPRKVLGVSMDTSCGRFAVAMLLYGRAGLVVNLAVHHDADPSSGLGAPDSAGEYIPLRQETGYRRVFWNVCTDEDPPLSVAISPQRSFVAFGSATGIEVHWIEANHQNVSRWFPLTAPSNHLYFLPSRRNISIPERVRLVSSAAIGFMADNDGIQSVLGPADEHRDFNAWSSEYIMGRWISRARDGHDSYHAIPLSDGEHVLFTDPRTQSLCLGGDAPIGGSTERERRLIFRGPEGIPPSVYAAGVDISTGLRVLAGYGDELFFFNVPIDIFVCCNSGVNEPWAPTYSDDTVFESRSSSPEVGSSNYHITSSSTRSDSPVTRMHSSSTFPLATREKRDIWPLNLSGQRLGTVPDLRDVAVNSRAGSLTLWAFSANGIAKAWQVRSLALRRIPHVVVNRCGNIAHSTCLSPMHDSITSFPSSFSHEREIEDGAVGVEVTTGEGDVSPSAYSRTSTEPFPVFDLDGDVVMHDAPMLSCAYRGGEELDGSTSHAGFGSVLGEQQQSAPEETRHRPDNTNERISAHPALAPLVLCEIHDGGGAVCRGWMVPQGETSGLVLQWQGNESDAHESEEEEPAST